ncbi:glutamate-1-semialdehyde 2,1-aminomutase [Prolixibacter denitrificans]|uniref:Glutamate-1-semialdehyde 2,1-aminomutase n=1 Tax=Prolixibacter denitrificans TaxID=1541063 RepID=A0A2P8CDX9_9BACT|nr:glutamate-1-semialdehyde 2,1-aminomutase [Prolixibacter denitrificans]PSK83170.1 glutamate-1-semialdehyde 2,1-aminomutase [Prolixibacter denitrificans]GET21947.1 glutamate-1-semialdehyde 2,1-aminomutase [Prolixibacter denitrificans]
MEFTKSIQAFQEALEYIPGGVNSPVRSFKSVESDPVFIESAKGSKVRDIDGNEYIDYVGSWGPMILGHAHPDVLKALSETMQKGTSFGAPTLLETEMARQVRKMMPSIESVRMVNSGTEATMSALRLARGYTGRDLVIKFEGCYHGHNDSFLIAAGSGALTFGTPNTPGVTTGTAHDTLTAQFNDLDSVAAHFEKHGDNIAALIIEPVTGNMGVVVPTKEFMQGVRDLCTKHGALLIFDEVMTGFRVAKGGAQSLLGIEPDLTTLGKIIGGGLPVGAYGGKKAIMDHLAPQGPVYQAGTLSGNPLAMAAGLTQLRLLDNDSMIYDDLERKAGMLEEGLKNSLRELDFPAVVNRVGSMFTLFFTKEEKVTSFADVMKCDTKVFSDYFKHSLESGIYMAPSQFEAGFVSAAHSDEDIQRTIEASYNALKKIKQKG